MTVSQIQTVCHRRLAFCARLAASSVITALAIPMNSRAAMTGRFPFPAGCRSPHSDRRTVRSVLIAAFFAAPLMLARWRLPFSYCFELLCSSSQLRPGTRLSVYGARGDFYGQKHSAANYGILLLAWGTAGIFGPLVGGWVFGTYKSYQCAFHATAATISLS